MIYPALTYLEEIGLASVETEGARKRYSLTEAGRDYYQQRQDVSSRILSDLERVGREMERARQVVESGVVSGDSDDGAKSKVNTLMEFNTGAYNEYITSLFAPQDSDLVEALAEMKRENVRNMNVSASEGKLLQVLALAIGAKRILEIGTLGGYSGIHLARALPEGGKLITLEIDPHHAEVARRNLGRAGVAQKVDIRIGPASETLEQLAQAGEPLFDLIFIDADKDGYTEYLRQSLPLLRVGGLLLADNTLPGAVLTQGDSGTKRYNAAVAECPGLTTIVIPTLRHQGIDGLTVSFRNA
jgi:predicted O-methyltransferase YrrM